MNGQRKQHWERIYRDKDETETSWLQPQPETSLSLIAATGEDKSAALIDVGGGASHLVDHLLDAGWQNLCVLDIAAAALARAQARLGARAVQVRWLEADLLEAGLGGPYRIWHDRAVFHFLATEAERARYLRQLSAHLTPGGYCIIATFALDGPTACSGLPVQRYSAQTLRQTLGADFKLLDSREETHKTPAGKIQQFVYSLFRYMP